MPPSQSLLTAIAAYPRWLCPATPVNQYYAPIRRAFSVVTAPPRHEVADVPCRSHGSIKIDIYHSSTPSSPIIIYLPPGPVLNTTLESEDDFVAALGESSGATVARVNYRASAQHQWPTPCHDVLAGYDWIREHLLRDDFDRPYLSRLGVYGQLLGGSLAATLALTECRLGESRIGAAALNNPITDWSFPDHMPAVDTNELPEPMAADETAFPANADVAGSSQVEEVAPPKSRRGRKPRSKVPASTAWQSYGDNDIAPTSTLIALREAIFRRPEDHLDRFASPAHFFRSPHVQLIQPQQDDTLASIQPDQHHDDETRMALAHFDSFDQVKKRVPTELPYLSRCRSYARGYPPAGNQLSLPVWYITTGMQSPLQNQAVELAKVLKSSTVRHRLKNQSGRSRWLDTVEKELYAHYAESRVDLQMQPGLGLHHGSTDEAVRRGSAKELGEWMKHRLAPEFT